MNIDDEYRLAPEELRGETELPAPVTASEPNRIQKRLCSLDAYRGLIMISLAFGGFGLASTARNHLAISPDHSVWQQVADQFSHAEWVGCNYWDLIQPSFMFMVGVSFAYSYAKRKKLGHSNLRMFGHAVWRSVILIVLGILLISNTRTSTNWSLVNVLTQIGLGYSFLFLMWRRSTLAQVAVATVVLAAVWVGYYYYPQIRDHDPVDATVAQLDRGVSVAWAQKHLVTVDRPWHKNANLGQEVDEWLLNLLPGQSKFEYQRGGYQTINFIPSFVTMLFGLMAGELLRSNRSCGFKLVLLILAGAAGLSAGWLMDATGFCPLVKRIWTPSWTLFSGGWCCLILATIYFLFDILPLRFLALPFVIVGVNSMAIYCMSMLLKPWVAQTFETHFGDQVFRLRSRWGDDLYRLWFVDDTLEQTIILYQPTIQAVMIGLVFWLICYWMYRQRLFVRI